MATSFSCCLISGSYAGNFGGTGARFGLRVGLVPDATVVTGLNTTELVTGAVGVGAPTIDPLDVGAVTGVFIGKAGLP